MAAALAVAHLGGDEPWLTFAVLAVGAAGAQLLVVPTGRSHGFHTAIVFTTAAALLLPPGLLALMGLAQHGIEGRVKRQSWYIQAFNVANATLNVLAAYVAFHLIEGRGSWQWALGAWTAALVLVLSNHALLALMLRVARGHAMRATGLLSPSALLIEIAPAALGIAFAWLWHSNPWLIPAALAPILLAHHTFTVLARLRESEQRFRAMFESAAIGAAVLGFDGSITSSNRALEEMLGYDKHELAGRPIADLAHPDDAERERELYAALGRGEIDRDRRDGRYVARDGEVVFAASSVALVRDASRKPLYALAMIENVTERKELESQLVQAQKMEAIGRLAGGVAHDFNNMLTAITGYSDLALCRLDAGGVVERRELEEIRKAAERAALLTGQLLAFSRKQTLQPRVLDPNDVMLELRGMLERLIGDDVELRTELAPDAGTITVDQSQLQQVVLNLVINAREAMPAGGTISLASRRIELSTAEAARAGRVPGAYTVLTVADTGAGMSEETRSRIFEPFFTTKSHGTGLGLSTVYGIVAQSGGFIEFDSELDVGTTYRVYLPQTDEPALDLEEPAQEGPLDESLTVLLAEDEDVVRAMLSELLESEGFTVLPTASAADAIAAALEGAGTIDLLLTDIAMPGMSGVQLVRELEERGAPLPVIFMSGYAGTALDETPELSVACRFLQKPFTRQDLRREVGAVLGLDRESVS